MHSKKFSMIRDEHFSEATEVHFDAKNRVSLGKLNKDIKTYRVYKNLAGQLLFDPQVSIPANEAWVFQNPNCLNSLRRGLKEAKEGKTKPRGSFVKFIEEE